MMRPKRTCWVGVCRACGENISHRIYMHNLFSQFEGQCLKPYDYTTALEDLTGPISQDDALPQIICETCRKLLKRYYKSFCDVEKIGSIFRESAQRQRESRSLAWRTLEAQQGKSSITPSPQERMTDACKVTPPDFTVTLVVVPKSENTDEDATPDPNSDSIKHEPAEISVYLEEDMEQEPQSGDDDDDDAASSKLSQVSVQSKYILSGPMEKLVENILNGQFFSAAKAIMEVPDLAPLVTKEVLNEVVKECKELTSVPFNSILRQTSPSSLEAFKWDTVFTEWKTTAPTFLRFLESASTSTWVSAMTKERTQRKNFAIGMAGATLLKARCGRMSAPMFRNSLILHQAQKKKCFNRFARLGVCVTRQSMLHLLRRVRASDEVTRTPSAGEDHNYDSVAPRRSTENTDRQEDPEPTVTEKQQEPRTSQAEEQLPESGTTESTTPTVTCTPLFRSKNHVQGPSRSQAKPKPLSEPLPQTQPQAQPKPLPNPQPQAQPKPLPNPQPQAQPKPLPKPQPNPQPQAQPQPFPTTFLLAHPSQPFRTAQNQTVMLSQQNAPLMIFTLPCVKSPAAQSQKVKDVESTTMLHNYNVPCSCQVCGQSFDFTRHLIRHVQMHSAEQNRLCGLCGKVLEPAENMAVHLQIHSLMKTFCHICGKCFPKNAELKYHISIYHYVEKPHLCEVCGKTFRLGKALKEHHTSFHIEGQDKPYKCHLCRKGFSGERQVKLHQLTHTGEKPYQCEDCGMCFREKNTLKGHMRTHTGEKPYKCRECGKCFRLLGALKCHLLTHTGEKPYRCNVCGRCFSQSSSRKTHMKTHKMAHAVERPQSAEKALS